MNLRDQLRRKFALQNIDNNTFIGGVAALIPDAASMATVLSIPASDIRNYKINGSDVSFTVVNDYTLTSGAFGSATGARGDVIIYYFDFGGKVISTQGTLFSQFNRSNPVKVLFYFPNALLNGTGAFESMQNAVIALKSSTPIGLNSGDNNVFRNSNNLKLFTNNANATNNSGNPDGDIVELLTNNGSVTYIPNTTTRPDRITNIKITNIGATYVDITFDLATHVNNYLYVIAVLNGVSICLSSFNSQRIYTLNPNSKTTLQLFAVDEYFNISPLSQKRTFLTGTINSTTLFSNAVAYYKLDETSGNAIEALNSYNGVDVGTIVKDGEWYNYSTNESYVEIADEDDFSFTDGTNNTDFVIKTEVIFDGFNTLDRAVLVSRRSSAVAGVQDWQFSYINGGFRFLGVSATNSFFISTTPFFIARGQKYILGVTLIGDVLKFFVNGQVIKTETIPSTFKFYNGSSKLQLGNDTSFGNFNLVGRQKGTVIIKGSGWTDGQISDNYNNGSGTTI